MTNTAAEAPTPLAAFDLTQAEFHQQHLQLEEGFAMLQGLHIPDVIEALRTAKRLLYAPTTPEWALLNCGGHYHFFICHTLAAMQRAQRLLPGEVLIKVCTHYVMHVLGITVHDTIREYMARVGLGEFQAMTHALHCRHGVLQCMIDDLTARVA